MKFEIGNTPRKRQLRVAKDATGVRRQDRQRFVRAETLAPGVLRPRRVRQPVPSRRADCRTAAVSQQTAVVVEAHARHSRRRRREEI